MMLSALTLSGVLYVLQLWQWVNLSLWIIVSPILIMSAIILTIMTFASVVALIYRK